jgi:metal-responsive CopG/Arc/MetJ family transcriptional regulator
MPNEPENPNPPVMRGRPSHTRDESEELVKVVSYIPKKLLPVLDQMAEEDGRSRASMIDRIIQAAINPFWKERFKQKAQDIRQVEQALEELQERVKKIISDSQKSEVKKSES